MASKQSSNDEEGVKMETMEDLEQSVLSMCNSDSDSDITIVNKEFHLSPAKMVGLQLSIYSTPISLSGLSPIIANKNCPQNIDLELTTPKDLKRKWHGADAKNNFSSTPTVCNPKRLRLNESGILSNLETVSEVGESFEELLESVSILCDKPTTTNNVSKIDLHDILWSKTESKNNESLRIVRKSDNNILTDENFLKSKTSDQTQETPRFRLLTTSRQLNLLDASTDDEGNMSEDILGLESYIIVDSITSDEEEDNDYDEPDLVESDATIVANKTLVEQTTEDFAPHATGSRVETILTTDSSGISAVESSVVKAKEMAAPKAGTHDDIDKVPASEVDMSEDTNSDQLASPKATTNKPYEATNVPLLDEPNTLSDQEEKDVSVKTKESLGREKQIENVNISKKSSSKSISEGNILEARAVATVKPLTHLHDVRIASQLPSDKHLHISSSHNISDSVIEVFPVEESFEVIDLTEDLSISQPPETTPPILQESETDLPITQEPETDLPITQEPETDLPITQQSETVPPMPQTPDIVPSIPQKPDTETSVYQLPETVSLTNLKTVTDTSSLTAGKFNKMSEDELMKKIKMCWGQDSVHDVNNNLTSNGYIKQKTMGSVVSVLEGNSRAPPLFRTSQNQNEVRVVGRGRTPADIAADIKKQITNLDFDSSRNIVSIEHGMKIQINKLKNVHRNQIHMLGQRQYFEFCDRDTFFHLNPRSVLGQYHQLQLREDHVNQREGLKYEHNKEMRNLLSNFMHEKDKVCANTAHVKSNLQDMINKLQLTSNQSIVDPDQVHTLVDLHKGPCKTNNHKQSLVQVCLPADIASYMIQEDEIYNMNYKHNK